MREESKRLSLLLTQCTPCVLMEITSQRSLVSRSQVHRWFQQKVKVTCCCNSKQHCSKCDLYGLWKREYTLVRSSNFINWISHYPHYILALPKFCNKLLLEQRKTFDQVQIMRKIQICDLGNMSVTFYKLDKADDSFPANAVSTLSTVNASVCGNRLLLL